MVSCAADYDIARLTSDQTSSQAAKRIIPLLDRVLIRKIKPIEV